MWKATEKAHPLVLLGTASSTRNGRQESQHALQCGAGACREMSAKGAPPEGASSAIRLVGRQVGPRDFLK